MYKGSTTARSNESTAISQHLLLECVARMVDDTEHYFRLQSSREADTIGSKLTSELFGEELGVRKRVFLAGWKSTCGRLPSPCGISGAGVLPACQLGKWLKGHHESWWRLPCDSTFIGPVSSQGSRISCYSLTVVVTVARKDRAAVPVETDNS